MVTTRLMSAEALLNGPDQGRCELVRGKIIRMNPPGSAHGRIVMRIAGPMHVFVEAHELGVVYGAETGFLLERDPDTVRAADVAFVRHDRVPPADFNGYIDGAPNLAVEVLLPSDRASDVNAKVRDWLAGGAQLVWVVDPRNRLVTVHRAADESIVTSEAGTLDAEAVLPGFQLEVVDVL